MFSIVFAAALMFAAGAPALAQEAPSAPPATAPRAQAAKKSNDIECRYEAEIGTRLKRKICRSKAKIEADAAETRQSLEQIQHSTGPSTQ